MGTKLKKLGFFVVSIFILAYFSFPWWSASLIKQKLPSGWEVSALDVGYPTFSSLKINKLSILSEQVDLSLRELNVDYSLSKIDIELAEVSLKPNADKTPKPNLDISLPEMPLNNLLQIITTKVKDDIYLSIEQFELQDQSAEYDLENIKANLNKSGSGELSFDLKSNQYLSKTSRIASSFNLSTDQFVSDFKLDRQQFLKFTYLQNQEITNLGLIINIEAIDKFKPLKVIMDRASVHVDGKLQLALQQHQSKALNSNFSYQGNIHFLHGSNKPISLKLASESNSVTFPFQLRTEVQLSSEQTSLSNFTLEDSQINLNTLISVQQDDFSFMENRIKTNINAIKSIEHLISISEIKLDSKIEDFSLKQLSLQDLEISNDISNMDISYQVDTEQPPIEGKLSGLVKLSGVIDSLFSGQLTIFPISIPDIGLSEFAEAKVKLDNVDTLLSKGSVSIKAEDYDGQISPLTYNKILVTTKLNLAQELITGDANIQINDGELTPLQFSFDRTNQAFDIDLIKHDVELALINQLIKKLPDDLPLIDLIKGSLYHQGKLKYSNNQLAVSDDNTIELSKVDLAFDDNKAFNINSTAQLKSITPIKIESNLSIERVELISGLEIESILSKLVLSDSKFDILDLEMKLLSGTISSDGISFFEGKLRPSLVSAKNISLTELIFFTKIESLFATGDLNLVIPLDTKNNAVVVENGTFTTLSKGIIKYSSGSPITMEDNIALFALKNFHYKKMDGTFSYNDKSGAYLLKIRLIGSNPELYDGYPIDFTFNIDGNLPGIFKSLFLSGSFEEAIMKSLKSEQSQ